MRKRNPAARMLGRRAGTAHAEISVDTRPKTILAKKGRGAPYRRKTRTGGNSE